MQEPVSVYDTVWNRIREQFTEDEKDELRQNICGQTICPRGMIVDLAGLSPQLATKVRTAVEAAKKGK